MVLKSAFLTIFLLICIERITFVFKYKEKEGNIKYRWTSFLLISSYIFCVCLALFDFFMWLNSFNMLISFIGLLVMSIGISLRQISVKTLGNNWSLHVKNIPNQQLIKTGPYKWIRHPYYLAVMFELIGVSLYFNSVMSLGYSLLVHFPLLLVRISLEENNLVGRFQVQYKTYRQETGMFLPRRF